MDNSWIIIFLQNEVASIEHGDMVHIKVIEVATASQFQISDYLNWIEWFEIIDCSWTRSHGLTAQNTLGH